MYTVAGAAKLSYLCHAMKTLDLTLSFLLLIAPAANAQQERHGDLYSVANSHINCLIQDHRGYLWLGTDNGLTRFDGTETLTLRRSNKPRTLLSNSVLSLLCDSRNNIWVGTTDGIQTLDSITLQLNTPRQSSPGVPDFSYVSSITEDCRGDIWFTTSRSGAVRIDHASGKMTCFTTANSPICSNRTTTLRADRHGNVWIGSMDAGLSVYNVETSTMRSVGSSHNDAMGALSGDMIFSIDELNDGRMLIGSLDGGVDIYDYSSRQIHHLPTAGMGNVFKLKNIPSENAVYIGTDGSGLWRWDISTNLIEPLAISLKEFDASRAKIHDIIQDQDGNLWLAAYQKGLIYVANTSFSKASGTSSPSGISESVISFGYLPFSQAYNVGTEAVLCSHQDRSGRLWIGTDGDGVYLTSDGVGSPLTHILSPEIMLCITSDSRGQVWGGSYMGGFLRWNEGSGRFDPIGLVDAAGASVHEVNCITPSGDGTLWIGTNGNGVCHFNPTDGSYKFLTCDASAPERSAIPGNSIHDILRDRDGKLWIGTSDAGLSCINPDNGSWRHYSYANQLSSNACFAVVQDSLRGDIWVATRDGLNRIRHGHSLTICLTNYGLQSNVVYDLEIDPQTHKLWMSTQQEIASLDLTNGRLRREYPLEGLTLRECKRGSASRGSDGRLYFGGVGGMVGILPQSSHRSCIPIRQLWFTSFDILNEGTSATDMAGDADIERGTSEMTQTILSQLNQGKISLQPHQNSVAVGFAAICYDHPEQLRYRVWLEGHDDDWISLPAGVHSVTYSNLPPGDYTLHISAQRKGQPLGADIPQRTLQMSVLPPFYLTWWAKSLYILLIAGCGWGLWRYARWRLAMTRRRDQALIQAQSTELKLQFFTDISHEIRTPLTLILGPLDSLKAKIRDRASLHTLEVMSYNGQRILRLIDQIMDLRRLDNCQMQLNQTRADFGALIHNVADAFDQTATDRHIKYTVKMPVPDSLTGTLALTDTDKVDKVLFNVLSNAFKFTPDGGSISLTVSAAPEWIELRVADSGPGIPRESLPYIFDRFYRSADARTAVKGGTGIGLHLSHKLVEILSGNLTVEATSPSGTTFLIRLPFKPVSTNAPASEVENSQDFQSVGHHRQVARAPQPPTSAPRQFAPRQFTALIVEDDASILDYLAQELQGHYNVILARNGAEALEKAISENPDIVVTDVRMEPVDGLELCRQLRANPETCDIPIIMLTARTTEAQKDQGVSAGADAYITKPFNMEHLVNQMAMLLRQRRLLQQKYSGEQARRAASRSIKSSDERLCERVDKVVQRELANPDLSVEFIAREIGVSRSHLHRRLKEATKMNPSDYIKQQRMTQAAAMLCRSGITVSEVAFALGFATLSHFSTCFKEHFGVSPTRYISLHTDNEPQSGNL